MGEVISLCQFSEEQEQQIIAASAQIGCVGLAEIDAEYGTGMPLWQPGRQSLGFHNGYHGRTTGEDTDVMAEHYGMQPVVRAVLRASAENHDKVQLRGKGVNEQESVDFVRDQMRKSGVFTPYLQEMAAVAIYGTEPILDEQYRLVGQRATTQEYISKEHEIGAKSLACGDLGRMYRPEGPLASHHLLREFRGMPDPAEITVEEMADFQGKQNFLLETYTYPLPEANRLLATHRKQVIGYSALVLKQLERGDITSWQQLIDQDEAFMRQHAG